MKYRRLIDVDELRKAILNYMPERFEVLLIVDQMPIYFMLDGVYPDDPSELLPLLPKGVDE